MVYLSCDRRQTDFIRTLDTEIAELNRAIPNFELVYPSRDEGTGFVEENVLRLQEADVVVFDITPTVSGSSTTYNAGVMIEYGMFLSLEKPRFGNPWGGRQPKPSHRIYAESPFERSTLTPIIKESSVRTYETSQGGLETLASELRNLLSTQAAAVMAFAARLNSSMATTPQLYRYPYAFNTS